MSKGFVIAKDVCDLNINQKMLILDRPLAHYLHKLGSLPLPSPCILLSFLLDLKVRSSLVTVHELEAKDKVHTDKKFRSADARTV